MLMLCKNLRANILFLEELFFAPTIPVPDEIEEFPVIDTVISSQAKPKKLECTTCNQPMTLRLHI